MAKTAILFYRNPNLPVNPILGIGKDRIFSFFLRLYNTSSRNGYCLRAAGFVADLSVVPQRFGLFDLARPDPPGISLLYADPFSVYFHGLCISILAAVCGDMDRLGGSPPPAGR